MTDLLFQIGLSNALLSLALAIVAMVVGARAKRPHLAYMLWLLVFVKLVTPPIVTIPVSMFSVQPDPVIATSDISLTAAQFPVDGQPAIAQTTPASSLLSDIGALTDRAKPWLVSIWLLGSVVVFVWSMVRVCRFSRVLAVESEVAPQPLQTAAAKMANRLGLNAVPMICTTSAHLSPMVWWTGGWVRVVVPTTLLDRMDAQSSQWILAHELAHVRRRDYLVRWLEWLACVCFWWNPVVWWAQRNLRAMEEICCDDLVISCLNPKPKLYADSLLSAVEIFAGPALRPPAMASEINSGGFLERRFKMIVSDNPNRSNSRWLQVCVLLCAMLVLPLGIASAHDYEAVGRRLRAAVAAGELTGEQARIMLGALRRAGAQQDEGADRARAYLIGVRERLGAAVEAGEISREDATKRYEAAEKGIRERMAAGRLDRDIRAEYQGFERRIKAAVAEGKMTREEAREKLGGFRRRMAMAERGERSERRITVEEYRRAEAEMRKMIDEGKAKPEDVERRLIEMRKMIGGQSKRGGERQRTTGGDKRAEYEGFARRIRAAVAEGKMTREQAGARIEAYKKSIGRGGQEEDPDKELDYDAIGKRLRAAVKAGKLTEEEAKAKWVEIKKRVEVGNRREKIGNDGRPLRGRGDPDKNEDPDD